MPFFFFLSQSYFAVLLPSWNQKDLNLRPFAQCLILANEKQKSGFAVYTPFK